MKIIGNILVTIAFLTFAVVPFLSTYEFSEANLENASASYAGTYKDYLVTELESLEGKTFTSKLAVLNELDEVADRATDKLVADGAPIYEKGNFDKYYATDYKFQTLKSTQAGLFEQYKWLWVILIWGLGPLGALILIIPLFFEGQPGIKNDGVFHNPATSRGWLGFLAFAYFFTFYVVLYFYPQVFTESVSTADVFSEMFGLGKASQWFMYGFVYTVIILVMGLRMFAKYRHNRYHQVRTASVMFFQLGFAFLIPNILQALGKPAPDLKNIWPLDYDFFYSYNIESLISSGMLGWIFLILGVANIFIAVPYFTYKYGKRWYCSWVCGCGGLAETLGDPYRQLSDKSLTSWKFERYIINGVLVFAVLMTGFTLASFFFGLNSILGVSVYSIQGAYKFGIGSMFAGVIGTGFYPVLGNRVWCRFGCPLAAIFGIIQKFQSRFRITTNADQCISCGNCSTYCEQGIDVKAYAQRGQNIVRSSCVGCGVCAAVCPRGVLRLENGPVTDDRNGIQAINLVNDDITVNL